MNDGEVRKAVDDIAKGADHFKKELDSSLKKDKTIDKATREAAVREADGLKQDAQKLASLVGDGRPASGEAQALLQHPRGSGRRLSGRTLSPRRRPRGDRSRAASTKCRRSFGLAKPVQ